MQDLQHLLGLHAMNPVVKAVQLSGQLQGELDGRIQMLGQMMAVLSIWQQGTVLYHFWRYVCFSCYTSSRESLQYKENGINGLSGSLKLGGRKLIT